MPPVDSLHNLGEYPSCNLMHQKIYSNRSYLSYSFQSQWNFIYPPFSTVLSLYIIFQYSNSLTSGSMHLCMLGYNSNTLEWLPSDRQNLYNRFDIWQSILHKFMFKSSLPICLIKRISTVQEGSTMEFPPQHSNLFQHTESKLNQCLSLTCLPFPPCCQLIYINSVKELCILNITKKSKMYYIY